MENAVPIDIAAVAVAAAVNIALGFLWYGPLFGKEWMKLQGITPERIAADKKKGMGKTYAVMTLGAVVMAYVMAHSMVFAEAYLKTSGVASGIMGGFWNWLGFVAPVTVGTVLWDGKPWKLWAINAGYWLVALCLMGVVLSTMAA
jgi:hypothetical protein